MDKTNTLRSAPLADDFFSLAELHKFLEDGFNHAAEIRGRTGPKILYLAVMERKKKDGKTPRLAIQPEYFKDKNGDLSKILGSLLIGLHNVPNSEAAVKKMHMDIKQQDWELSELLRDVSSALQAERAHSPLSNAYARQWEKQGRAIASHMLAFSGGNNASPSAMPRLASRAKIVLHGLSTLPDDFGLCASNDEILQRLTSVASSFSRAEKDAVAQRSLAMRQDSPSRGADTKADKVSFALALNRVIRYLAAASDGALPFYGARDCKEDIHILACFAKREAIRTGCTYRSAAPGFAMPANGRTSFSSSASMRDGPVPALPASPPSGPREREKSREPQRVQTGEARVSGPAYSPREPEHHERHRPSRAVADQQKITPREEPNGSKLPKVPSLDAPSRPENGNRLKTSRRPSQGPDLWDHNNMDPDRKRDVGSRPDETGRMPFGSPRGGPDTAYFSGKEVAQGKRSDEPRKSQRFSLLSCEPATAKGNRDASNAPVPTSPPPVEESEQSREFSTVLHLNLSKLHSQAQGRNGDNAATLEQTTESFVFDSMSTTAGVSVSAMSREMVYSGSAEDLFRTDQKNGNGKPRQHSVQGKAEDETAQPRITEVFSIAAQTESTSSTDS